MNFVSITTAMLAVLFLIGLMSSYSSANTGYDVKTEKRLMSDNGSDDGYMMVKSQTRDRKKDGSCDGTQQQNGSKNGSGTKSKNGNGSGKGSGDRTRSRDGSNCDGTGPKSANPGGNSRK